MFTPSKQATTTITTTITPTITTTITTTINKQWNVFTEEEQSVDYMTGINEDENIKWFHSKQIQHPLNCGL